MSLPKDLSTFDSLLAVMKTLRSPEGCPWDRKQTHRSLRENLLEESYEVLEALDAGDPKELCEELGDLLMQVVFHAQIAEECGEFTVGDVISGINTKLVYRHPHVWGDVRVKDADDVLRNWEMLKQKEKGERKSLLGGAPKGMPSLAYSQEIQGRAAQAGFDWPDTAGVIEKLNEEVNELQSAADKKQQEDEFGDLLFTLANLGRKMGIDLESALRGANAKFVRRFTAMEEAAANRGLKFQELSLDEQNGLWNAAKKAEG